MPPGSLGASVIFSPAPGVSVRARHRVAPKTSRAMTTPPTMAATPMAHMRESRVVGLIFSSLKKRSIHKKRASRPVVCFDQKSPVVSEKAHTDDSLVCSEEASSPPAEATRLHLPSISPAQCHMLHVAARHAPAEPAKQSKSVKSKIAKRQEGRTLDSNLNSQFDTGRLLAAISSRPGQCGRCDGFILEGKELEFYVKRMARKKK